MALRKAVPKPQEQEARKNAWISEATWRIVDERVSARRDTTKYHYLIPRLGRAIVESLKVNRRRRAEEAGAEVEALLGLDPPLHQEAWHRIKGWYRAAVDGAMPPARVTLKRITAERVDLYIYVPSPGANIPISEEPLLVDDLVTTEVKTKWAVKRLQNHLSRGPSGMRDKHLKGWLAAERKKEKEEAAAGEEMTESKRGGNLRNLRRHPTGRWW